MKRFKFQLEPLMRIAHLKEEEARGNLMRAELEVSSSKKRLDVAVQASSNTDVQLSRERFDLFAFMAINDLHLRQIEFSVNVLREAEERRTKRQVEWQSTKIESESYDRLRNRAHETYIEEFERQEQKETDEVASMMWLQNREGERI